MTLVKWFQRRKARKFIKESFKTVNLFIHECSASAIGELIKAYQELLDDYRAEYGDDDIYLYYLGRLEYFKLIKCWKERQEYFERGIIEE